VPSGTRAPLATTELFVSHKQSEVTMAWDLIQQLRPYLLEALGAAALLLLGSIVGRFVGSSGRRAAQATLDRLGRRGAGAGAVGAARLGESVPALLGQFL
jgi:hypothetical protein